MKQFSDSHLKLIRDWNEALPRRLSLRMLDTPDERSAHFREFGEELARRASKVRFVPEAAHGIPALLLGGGWQYHLVPGGAEFKPFLELSTLSLQGVDPGAERELPSFEGVARPSQLKLYVTLYCPHCRDMVRRIMPLPLLNTRIGIVFIDGMLFPELAARDEIHSVPTLICNNRFRWTGPVDLQTLREVLVQRDPAQLPPEAFIRMIQEKDVNRLVEMMAAEDQIFPGFLETLIDPEFQTRLGAMVAFEEIAERRPQLVKKALEHLWRKIPAADESVRGDMIYLIGKTGEPEWISRLEGVGASKLSKDLRGVLEEAIESLRSKQY